LAAAFRNSPLALFPKQIEDLMTSMHLFAVPGLPSIQPGDDVAALIAERLAAAGETLQPGDILVIAQKIVSKAEGRLVRLADVQASALAEEIAATVGKEARVIQVVLDDSREVLRVRRGLLVVEQRSGWVCANAGVDRSNVQPGDESDYLALLPADADASAEAIRVRLAELTGVTPIVIINDSHGRAWRIGTVGTAIGCAGLPPIWNQRGLHDLFGYELVASEECIADELAAAASLVMGQSDEGRPVVIVRGYALPPAPPASAQTIQRLAAMDAFR
jgi:coenzyme F420-0:L-glutamate ligase/coenzyme F420-1:gamma-L-glutamate ligase